MDTSNGLIGTKEDLLASGSVEENIVRIRTCEATEKQLREKRVSVYDRRSVLGKVLTKNQAKARRRKLAGK